MEPTTINTIITGIFLILATLLAGYLKINADKLGNKLKKVSEELPSPQLLYEHDENGNPIKGTIDRLIAAVKKGYPIKIMVKQPGDITRLFDAHLVAVEDGIVNAFNSSLVSLKREGGVYDIQARPYHYFVVVSTKGTHNVRRVYFDGETGEASHDKWHMVWIGLMPSNQKE